MCGECFGSKGRAAAGGCLPSTVLNWSAGSGAALLLTVLWCCVTALSWADKQPLCCIFMRRRPTYWPLLPLFLVGILLLWLGTPFSAGDAEKAKEPEPWVASSLATTEEHCYSTSTTRPGDSCTDRSSSTTPRSYGSESQSSCSEKPGPWQKQARPCDADIQNRIWLTSDSCHVSASDTVPHDTRFVVSAGRAAWRYDAGAAVSAPGNGLSQAFSAGYGRPEGQARSGSFAVCLHGDYQSASGWLDTAGQGPGCQARRRPAGSLPRYGGEPFLVSTLASGVAANCGSGAGAHWRAGLGCGPGCCVAAVLRHIAHSQAPCRLGDTLGGSCQYCCVGSRRQHVRPLHSDGRDAAEDSAVSGSSPRHSSRTRGGDSGLDGELTGSHAICSSYRSGVALPFLAVGAELCVPRACVRVVFRGNQKADGASLPVCASATFRSRGRSLHISPKGVMHRCHTPPQWPLLLLVLVALRVICPGTRSSGCVSWPGSVLFSSLEAVGRYFGRLCSLAPRWSGLHAGLGHWGEVRATALAWRLNRAPRCKQLRCVRGASCGLYAPPLMRSRSGQLVRYRDTRSFLPALSPTQLRPLGWCRSVLPTRLSSHLP